MSTEIEGSGGAMEGQTPCSSQCSMEAVFCLVPRPNRQPDAKSSGAPLHLPLSCTRTPGGIVRPKMGEIYVWRPLRRGHFRNRRLPMLAVEHPHLLLAAREEN